MAETTAPVVAKIWDIVHIIQKHFHNIIFTLPLSFVIQLIQTTNKQIEFLQQIFCLFPLEVFYKVRCT
jgi:hypothetical protein